MTLSKIQDGKEITVSFNYSESGKNIYKHFDVKINGKQSNATGLKKYIAAELPLIISAKTYFWTPSKSAEQRRRTEISRISEVESFLKSQGFN